MYKTCEHGKTESEFHSMQEEDIGVVRKILIPVFCLDGQIIIQKDI